MSWKFGTLRMVLRTQKQKEVTAVKHNKVDYDHIANKLTNF